MILLLPPPISNRAAQTAAQTGTGIEWQFSYASPRKPLTHTARVSRVMIAPRTTRQPGQA
jgi:hypothetical protein